MPKRIGEQVIVITGASSGIGLAPPQAAARQGARVVLAARNERDLEKAAEEIRRDGGEAIAVRADVAIFDDVQRLASRAVETYGGIESWVNNAAVSAYAPFRELVLKDVQRIMQVNFMGQVHGAMAPLPHLETSHGALICVGSALSDRGVPLQSIYCASKHAIKGWLDSLRVELQRDGSPVRVTLIKPSSINTPLFEKAKTQLGVMPQPIPPVDDPDLATAAILCGAAGNERDVFVGGAGKLLSSAERTSPKLVDLQQRRQGFAAQKTDWPKSADAPHNLYEPVEYDGGVRGDFLDGSHQRSMYQHVDAHAVVSALGAAAVCALGAMLVRRTSPDRTLRLGLEAGALAFAGKALLPAVYEG